MKNSAQRNGTTMRSIWNAAASLLALNVVLAGCSKSELNGSESHFVACEEDQNCPHGTCNTAKRYCVDDKGEPIRASDALSRSDDDQDKDDAKPGQDGADAGAAMPELPQKDGPAGNDAAAPSKGLSPVGLQWLESGDATLPRVETYTVVDEDTLLIEGKHDLGPFSYECRTQIPSCAERLCLDHVIEEMNTPEAYDALVSAEDEVFGCDVRNSDQSVRALSFNDKSVILGDPEECNGEPTPAIPPAIRALFRILFSLSTQQQSQCSYEGPEEITWGLDGGFTPLRQWSKLTAGHEFSFGRPTRETDPPRCSNSLPDCTVFADDFCFQDLRGAFNHPVVKEAIAKGGLYGGDPRPVDGQVFQITAGGAAPLLIGECISATCDEIPGELRDLREMLEKITEQQLAAPGCEDFSP